MSVRWMAVQYLGNTLRLPVTNECDLHKPFGVSKLERDVERIIANPFSGARRTFVPIDANIEKENEKLRNLMKRYVKDYMYESCGDCWGGLCDECQCLVSECADELRELGIEVEE